MSKMKSMITQSCILLKEIPEYTGYLAGSDGNIYSCWGSGKSGLKHNVQRKLKQNKDSKDRYLLVNIKKDGDDSAKTRLVHRLVCLAFKGPPPNEKYAVSHLDGSTTNNMPCNLIWESMSENHRRKLEHNTHDRGYYNSRSKITKDDLNKIRFLLNSGDYKHWEIAEMFNVNRVFVTKINCGHRYYGV